MSLIVQSDTFFIGGHRIHRLSYGAMQLTGPGIFGPPKDRDAALTVSCEVVSLGIDHIDMSDFYSLHITNQLIREALHLCRDDLLIVTRVGAGRGAEGIWLPAFSAQALTEAVHDNLHDLGLDVLDVVNLWIMFNPYGLAEGSIEVPLITPAELQRQGLMRHIGPGNTMANQIVEGRCICEIVYVQNHYSLIHRNDDGLIDALTRDGIVYVPYFPLGGFSPLQSPALSDVAAWFGTTSIQTALAWLLQRSPDILLVPSTSSAGRLRKNLGAAAIALPGDAMREPDAVALSVDAVSQYLAWRSGDRRTERLRRTRRLSSPILWKRKLQRSRNGSTRPDAATVALDGVVHS